MKFALKPQLLVLLICLAFDHIPRHSRSLESSPTSYKENFGTLYRKSAPNFVPNAVFPYYHRGQNVSNLSFHGPKENIQPTNLGYSRPIQNAAPNIMNPTQSVDGSTRAFVPSNQNLVKKRIYSKPELIFQSQNKDFQLVGQNFSRSNLNLAHPNEHIVGYVINSSVPVEQGFENADTRNLGSRPIGEKKFLMKDNRFESNFANSDKTFASPVEDSTPVVSQQELSSNSHNLAGTLSQIGQSIGYSNQNIGSPGRTLSSPGNINQTGSYDETSPIFDDYYQSGGDYDQNFDGSDQASNQNGISQAERLLTRQAQGQPINEIFPVVPSQGLCLIPPAVENFKLNKYIGRWYEIERFFDPFQSNDCVTGDLSIFPNCSISLITSNVVQGKLEMTFGNAVAGHDPSKGEMIVRFPGKSGPDLEIFQDDVPNYTVIATDYDNYAVVYGCRNNDKMKKFEYSWIMGRRDMLNTDFLNNLKVWLKKIGIQVEKYMPTNQKRCFRRPLL